MVAVNSHTFYAFTDNKSDRQQTDFGDNINKKLSHCWETARRERMPKIADMDVEMTN